MVRFVNDNTGRFSERPHYEGNEIDRECESIIKKLLRDRHGKVEFPVSTDDLEILLEQRTSSLDMYANLESQYGPDVEGVTEFYPNRKPVVKISKQLSEDERLINRLRTTMTHEFGHVHYHSYLWEERFKQASLFSTNTTNNIIVCKRDTMISSSKTDWMEWQAGYVCGAILMPASHARSFAKDYFDNHSIKENLHTKDPRAIPLIEEVALAYQVSKDAARVRLSVLNILSQNNQASFPVFTARS